MYYADLTKNVGGVLYIKYKLFKALKSRVFNVFKFKNFSNLIF